MAENNIENNDQAPAAEQTERKGRRIRVGYLLLSFVPYAIITMIQAAAIIPGVILSLIDLTNSGLEYDFKSLMMIFNQKYALVIYIVYSAAAIAVFLIWYYKGFVKRDPKVFYKKALGVKPLVLTLALIACMFFIVTGAFSLVEILLPEVVNRYRELMEVTSLGSNMMITVIYGLILGPIVEELCFRGVAFRLLEKAGLHFVLAIVIQAAMFGIAHANLIQGLYTFCMGLVFGYLRYKYRTLLISIAAHMFFNFTGTIVATKLGEAGVTDNMYMIFGAICVVFAAGLFILITKDKGVYSEQEAAQ